MADRVPPAHIRLGTNRVTRAATSTTGVRRNLFQSHLSRRHTPTGPAGASTGTGGGPAPAATSSSSTSAESLRLDVDVLSDSSDIVIRDQNGEFEMDPLTPPLDDADDEPALDDVQENQRERVRLAEAVRHHQINYTRTPAHPEGNPESELLSSTYANDGTEVLEVLRASMKAKVAALAEDNWMYEPEDQRAH